MKEILVEFISGELLQNAARITPDENLLNTGIDSIGVMRLVAFIEDSFQVSVPPEDVTIQNFISVDAMERYIRSRE